MGSMRGAAWLALALISVAFGSDDRRKRADVRLIPAAAERLGAPVPLSRVHRDLLEQAEAAGYGSADNTAVIKPFE